MSQARARLQYRRFSLRTGLICDAYEMYGVDAADARRESQCLDGRSRMLLLATFRADEDDRRVSLLLTAAAPVWLLRGGDGRYAMRYLSAHTISFIAISSVAVMALHHRRECRFSREHAPPLAVRGARWANFLRLHHDGRYWVVRATV